VRFPKLVAVATLTIFAVAACGSAATPAPATQAPATLAAATPGSSGAATPVTATGSPTGAASVPAGAATDPCSLLSAADLNKVTGAKYAAGVFDATYKWCDWNVAVKDGGGEVILAISDNPFATVKGVLLQGVNLTISGHAAFWDPESGVMSMLVDLGGKTLELSFPKASKEGVVDQAMAQKLAELALSKM
jgi:hypothetical protein